MAEAKKATVPEIVVVGSCNTDFCFYTNKMPKIGETVRGNTLMTSFGGKGANQCVAAKRLGGSVAMVARVGDDDFGEEYIEYLQKEGVNTGYMMKTDDCSTGSAQITVAQDGKNVIVINPGANKILSPKDILKVKSMIETAKVLILQLEVPLAASIQAMKLCKGISIMNASPVMDTYDRELLTLPTIFLVNEVEAESFSGVPASTVEAAKGATEILLSKGCKSVIITIGEHGCVYGDGKTPPKHYSSPKVTPVDCTGAGDAFAGALGYMLSLDKYPMDKVLEVACAVGAACVTRPGAHGAFVDGDFLKQHGVTS